MTNFGIIELLILSLACLAGLVILGGIVFFVWTQQKAKRGSTAVTACPGCGKNVAVGMNFCPNCGERIPTATPPQS
jgi:hypothetical protein